MPITSTNRWVKSILVLCLLIGLSACTDDPQPSIDESTYEDILIELELIVTLHTQIMDSTITDSLIGVVWQKYGVTEDMFKESHLIYVQDVDAQLERINRISTRLSEEQLETEMKLFEMREQERLETQARIEAMQQSQQ
ncbi:MAG TPA: hypothetical protein DCE78_12260 [Bacteroidetes bacterium]|nr:hypothetical protein [Bacteroidota bacterium]